MRSSGMRVRSRRKRPSWRPPVRELKVVHADSLIAAGAAALVPRAPVVAKPATEQLAPDYPKQRPVDVEPPLETAPSANDTIASYVPAATSVAVPIAEADEEKRGWRETWLGVLLIALGLISLMSSSATLRGYRAGRAISRSEDKSTANRRTFYNFHVTRRHSVGKFDVTEIGHHGARHHVPVPKLAQQFSTSSSVASNDWRCGAVAEPATLPATRVGLPGAIRPDIVKAESTSSRRAAAYALLVGLQDGRNDRFTVV